MYLSRFLVVLLGFAALAIGIDYCLDAMGYRAVRSTAAQDEMEADR